ncbi:pilin [Pistricoccus aurantiacus]|uniref:pilin n=1 Tax=Pistricoccus aurantiacus TaxID=1883414 RepID=UPI00362A8839
MKHKFTQGIQGQARKQGGFTLIELMIVVAIIGILAAIAIPQYQDYTARSQMSEAMTLSSSLKTSVSEIYAQQGTLTGINSGALGIPANTAVAGQYVDNVAVANGVITATMESTGVASPIASAQLVLTPDVSSNGTITWNCTGNSSSGNAGSIDTYVPQSCRGT